MDPWRSQSTRREKSFIGVFHSGRLVGKAKSTAIITDIYRHRLTRRNAS